MTKKAEASTETSLVSLRKERREITRLISELQRKGREVNEKILKIECPDQELRSRKRKSRSGRRTTANVIIKKD